MAKRGDKSGETGNSGDSGFILLRNFRDIGGIPASGKAIVRKGIVFRAANPDKLSRADAERLRLLNIRTVIDLRAPGEAGKRIDPIDSASRLSLPLDFQQTTRERLRPLVFRKDALTAISDVSNDIYLEILGAAGPVFGKVLETIASPGLSPVLIHCQAGKDRTGIISALILLAVGVERELIISDFMKSNDALLPYFRRHFLIRKILTLGYFPYRNMIYAVIVKKRNIESVLDRVQQYYGGIEGYLKVSGFDVKLLNDVRSKLLE